MGVSARVASESARPADLSPAAVARRFERLLGAGARLRPAGTARHRPRTLLARGYGPKSMLELFDTTFYLSRVRQNPTIRFFVAYVVGSADRGRAIHPRIFYKDVSLIWRVASHFIRTDEWIWIGKGDVRRFVCDGEEVTESDEATTDLPLEIQTALDAISRQTRRIPSDEIALDLVLRRGPADRIAAYRDFIEPRRRAQADPGKQVHGGRPVARFTRPGDPRSLVIVPGFEPDFSRGVVETGESTSGLYGGRVRRFRVLSRNREIQYLFFAAPRHVWLAPPQDTGTDLTSYGVRPVDVVADEDLSIPGYEYHFMDETEDPPVLRSQIPAGYVGTPSEVDPMRSDASAWLDALPVVRAFRRRVLGERTRAATPRRPG